MKFPQYSGLTPGVAGVAEEKIGFAVNDWICMTKGKLYKNITSTSVVLSEFLNSTKARTLKFGLLILAMGF